MPRRIDTHGKVANKKDSKLRVGASRVMFLNMLHEGLCFLVCLQHGQVSKNICCASEELKPNLSAILTQIYGKDVLRIFAAILLGILRSLEVLNAYLLDTNFDWTTVWSFGTPENVSGATVLLAQCGLFPRDPENADMDGNPASPGRRNVVVSRGQILENFHGCAECMKADDIPLTWQAHIASLRDTDEHLLGICNTCRLDRGAPELVNVSDVFGKLLPRGFDEEQAFRTLSAVVGDVCRLVASVFIADPKFLTSFLSDGNGNVLDTIVPEMFVDTETIEVLKFRHHVHGL